MAFQNGEFSFHVWHRDPKTNVRKWCGQFLDATGALAWKKKQANPDEFTVNNIGPTGMAAQITPGTTKRQPTAKATEAMAEARAASFKQERKRQAERAEKQRKTEERRTADREAVAGIRDDAKKLLGKHKADEAEDLKKGINR